MAKKEKKKDVLIAVPKINHGPAALVRNVENVLELVYITLKETIY